MYPFKDDLDREWEIPPITLNVRQQVLKDTDFDLFAILDEDLKLWASIHNDLMTRYMVIESLVRPQRDALGMSDDEFNKGMGGDALKNGLDALEVAMSDFFRATGKTQNFHRLCEKLSQVGRMLGERTLNQFESISDESLVESFRQSFGRLPGSPAVIRGGTPGDN